jgi:hypothetical protein
MMEFIYMGYGDMLASIVNYRITTYLGTLFILSMK